ncbi:hypothetical protein BDP27DRAFT_1337510 [Rhodocollybia butyracea]|uniref:Uncharacterized protein n=1 Tax=Rhodocollybia butyracea TaxID=206335 RepID=A0A9P5PFP8_9AGAR|nr:hypothetical protein BDP27DRAFT_1337510 [Rhodocollybia butyracea]
MFSTANYPTSLPLLLVQLRIATARCQIFKARTLIQSSSSGTHTRKRYQLLIDRFVRFVHSEEQRKERDGYEYELTWSYTYRYGEQTLEKSVHPTGFREPTDSMIGRRILLFKEFFDQTG